MRSTRSASLSRPTSVAVPSLHASRFRPQVLRSSVPWKRFYTDEVGVVGLEFGVSTSCVAVMENGESRVIENLEGARVTPSVVAVTDEGKHVGSTAKRSLVLHKDSTFNALKLLLGKPYTVELAEQLGVRYTIVEGPNGRAAIQLKDKVVSVEELSGSIISYIKDQAQNHIGSEVKSAVFTIPASFDDTQKTSFIEAVGYSGMTVRATILEPFAAIQAYNLQETHGGKTVVVVDLGGRSAEVTVVSIAMSKQLTIVGSAHSDTIGGWHIDKEVYEYLMSDFQTKHGIDCRGDKVAAQKVQDTAERVKNELSTSLASDVNLPYIAADQNGPKHMEIRVSRSKLEQLGTPVYSAIIPLIEEALTAASVSKGDIATVVLSGGLTRTPKIRDMLDEYFEKECLRELNPEELHAIGAAKMTFAEGAASASESKDIMFSEVPYDISIETFGGRVHTLIPRNSRIPAYGECIVTTVADDQRTAFVKLVQGFRMLATDSIEITSLKLEGLESSPYGEVDIYVRVSIGEDAQLRFEIEAPQQGLLAYTTANPTSSWDTARVADLTEMTMAAAKTEFEVWNTYQQNQKMLDSINFYRRVVRGSNFRLGVDALTDLEQLLDKLTLRVATADLVGEKDMEGFRKAYLNAIAESKIKGMEE